MKYDTKSVQVVQDAPVLSPDDSLVISIGEQPFGVLRKSDRGAVVQPIRSQVSRPIRLGPMDEELLIPSFFAHLLPDAPRRELLARRLGCASDDGFGLLCHVGDDLVGDIVLFPSEGCLPSAERSSPRFDDISDLTREISALRSSADYSVIKASTCLPGGSQKVSVLVRSEAMPWTVGNTKSPVWSGGPSLRGGELFGGQAEWKTTTGWTSYLVKFEDPRFPGLLVNEALIRRAASAARVRVPPGQFVVSQEGDSALVVERFDRGVTEDNGQAPVRLAVEDGCQVLGVSASMRYRVATEELALALSERCAATLPMRLEFFRLVLFASLVGHGDLHASNVALLRSASGEWRLAPAFDLASTAVYGDESMALSIGGRTVRSLGERECLELGGSLGLSAPLVRSVCIDLQSRLRKFITTIVQVKALTAVEHKVISEILIRLDLLRLA